MNFWLRVLKGKSDLIYKFDSSYSLKQCLLLFFVGLGGGTPAAYGSSQVRVESELQPLASTIATATATQDRSCVCNLHHSSWQHKILNPLSEARDRTLILLDNIQVRNPLRHNWNPYLYLALSSSFFQIVKLVTDVPGVKTTISRERTERYKF